MDHNEATQQDPKSSHTTGIGHIKPNRHTEGVVCPRQREPKRYRRGHMKRRVLVHGDRRGCPKSYHAALPESVLSQSACMMKQLRIPVCENRPSTQIEVIRNGVKTPVESSTGGNHSGVSERTVGKVGHACNAPGHLGSVKLNFLVDTGRTHNL